MTAATTTRPRGLQVLLLPLHWVERARGRRRLALLALYGLILAAIGLLTWRAVSLNALPDVGDPFGDAARGGATVADADNAFVVYRQAERLLTPPPMGLRTFDPPAWSKADADVRAWVEANRPALALYRRGARRPAAMLVRPEEQDHRRPIPSIFGLRDGFGALALLEASRLEEAGDLAGAGALYADLLRACRHAGMNGAAVQTLVGDGMLRGVLPKINALAEDPATPTETLRLLLADAGAAEAMTPRVADVLRAEYLALMNELRAGDHTNLNERTSGREWVYNLPGAVEAVLFLKREPERSRRVVRLAFANWLSACDLPRAEQVPAGTDLFLYRPPADAPPAARALPPEAIDRWYQSAILARNLLPSLELARTAPPRELAQLRLLQLVLAEHLYRRDHAGAPPKRLADLLGPDLKHLPEGFEPDDPAVTVELDASTPGTP